ncbi:hypothetical protein GYMLUDRAFT_163666 [Collybiopsis luxurians FD-317 M1]|uniref:Copia protein n=1 Tax=Collybiopsis luxurians FD-317 M1 TaxID=944289 RepID=A0A0D0CUL2_9AGAR|nr:hypothetical protein GYMLUDRAFT_163666 [Collybiopsis luxurians FD-317 M1]
MELGYSVKSPSDMWVDNQSAIQVAKNPEHHVLMPKYLPIEDNAADMLTKALVKPKVEKFRQMMGLVKK